MHTYTIITISDYHNIDHNCMRPGGLKISEGLGAWRRPLGFANFSIHKETPSGILVHSIADRCEAGSLADSAG